MDLELKKQEIKAEIEKTEDEKLLWAIARLLHIDDDGDVPEWHKSVVREREVKYEKDNIKMLDWDEAKKSL
jgi:hypothetical protein